MSIVAPTQKSVGPLKSKPLKSNPCGHRVSKIVGQAQGTLILIKNKNP